MKIETYIHGSSGDAAMWVALGPLFTCRGVVADLGGLPIYSVPGVHWFVAFDGARVVGFAAMRIASRAVWYDYAYVVEDRRGSGVYTALTRVRDREAAHSRPSPLRAVIREARIKHYKSRGWKIASKRGAWLHITKDQP